MSREHLFCTWGCQKKARANWQDHSGRESIPDNVSKTGPKAPDHNLAASKKIEKLPKILKIGARNFRLNRDSTNLWRFKSITALDFWTKFFNHPSMMFFINIERPWKSSHKVCAVTVKFCAAASEHIFLFVAAPENVPWFLRNVPLLLKDIKKNLRLLLKRQFVKLFLNIFFMLKKICDCFWELCPLKKCFEVKNSLK